MLQIPVNTYLLASTIQTSFATDRGTGGNLYAFNQPKVLWELEFQAPAGSSSHRSNLKFFDDRGLTHKLIAELFFESRLPDVYKLQMTGMEVILRSPPTSRYDRHRHVIKLSGRGHHSFVHHEASDFTYEAYTSETMNNMIDALLALATKAPL